MSTGWVRFVPLLEMDLLLCQVNVHCLLKKTPKTYNFLVNISPRWDFRLMDECPFFTCVMGIADPWAVPAWDVCRLRGPSWHQAPYSWQWCASRLEKPYTTNSSGAWLVTSATSTTPSMARLSARLWWIGPPGTSTRSTGAPYSVTGRRRWRGGCARLIDIDL